MRFQERRELYARLGNLRMCLLYKQQLQQLPLAVSQRSDTSLPFNEMGQDFADF